MISPRMITSRRMTPTLPSQASPTASTAVQGRMGNRPGPIQRPTPAPAAIGGRSGMTRTKTGGVVRPVLGSMKHGGKVKKTGLYRMHKGENVMPLSSLAGKGRR